METGQLEIAIDELMKFAQFCDVILFEPSLRGKTGGMGLNYDYEKIISPYLQYCKRFSIAGGLKSDNLPEALKLNPYAVHVSSGVESEVGKKDREKVKEFIRRCK
jgi:phosphoribosylanthranilate isomerase